MFEIVKKCTNTEKGIEGYKFTGNVDVDTTIKSFWDDNRWDDEVDSFYDGWVDLCRNTENGELYGVLFDLDTKEPLIWRKVEKDV